MADVRKPASPKVFDVAKPGKTPPPATSKPVIVTNRPVLKDPMMVADEPAETPRIEKHGSPVIGRITIQPIEPAAAEPTAKEEPEQPAEANDAADAGVPIGVKIKQARKAAASKPETPAEAPAADDTPAVLPADEAKVSTESKPESKPPTEKKVIAPLTDSIAKEPAVPAAAAEADSSGPTADDGPAAAAAAADAGAGGASAPRYAPKDGTAETNADVAAHKAEERTDELHKLADSHKYYLPINQVEKRRTKREAIIGVIVVVLLLLAWADIALDAGLVTIPGIKAPTHFFKK